MEEPPKIIYDDFYVAYFDKAGNLIYPSDVNEAKTIKALLKNMAGDNLTYTPSKKICYKVRVKRKMYNETMVQTVELSNITEYINQISRASVDEITHLSNRKMARMLFIQYIEEALKNNENFAIILSDLDDFKDVNDTYGHNNGDIVLREVSRILVCSTRQEIFRESDIVARLGGDEFVIILKNIDEQLAIKKAENIRRLVEEQEISLFSESTETTKVKAGTLSMGLYYVPHEELVEFYDKGYTTDEIRLALIDRCDSALYVSKNNGKNKVTVYSKDRTLKKER